MSNPQRAVSGKAFATLLMVACLFAANHIAARIAFNHGVDVPTAVFLRSALCALAIAALLLVQGVSWRISTDQIRPLLLIGGLIGIQSLTIYSAVARLPVALGLLAFNSYPIWTALWAWLLHRQRPERAMLLAMPVILLGLALALDVFGAASGLGAAAQWGRIWAGLLFALSAAASFGLALVITQYHAQGCDSRVRTVSTLAITAVLSMVAVASHGGLHLPIAPAGWGGLAALIVLYGTAFTIMFTLLPRLGVVGNSAIMNVEPVFALVLAWLILDQTVAPIQVIGALLVVAAVVRLGLRRR